MVITKSANRIDYLNKQKISASIGCETCPACGNTEDVRTFVCSTWAKGFFKTKHMKQDCYHCKKCGCEWESDPYEYV